MDNYKQEIIKRYGDVRIDAPINGTLWAIRNLTLVEFKMWIIDIKETGNDYIHPSHFYDLENFWHQSASWERETRGERAEMSLYYIDRPG